jgi:MFS family permease
MKPAHPPTPTWKAPTPYGYPAAIGSASAVAAPLLAGFAITVIAQLLTQHVGLRWPSATLAVLAAAAALLIATVQLGFWARQWHVTPAELESWWPDHDEQDRWEQLRSDQAFYAENFRLAAAWVRRTYNGGILALLIGLGLAFVPQGHVTLSRAVGIGVFAAAGLLELVWIVKNWSETLGAPSEDPFSPRRRRNPTGV